MSSRWSFASFPFTPCYGNIGEKGREGFLAQLYPQLKHKGEERVMIEIRGHYYNTLVISESCAFVFSSQTTDVGGDVAIIIPEYCFFSAKQIIP